MESCELVECSLWNYHPKSRSKMADSAPVQLHYESNHREVKAAPKLSSQLDTTSTRVPTVLEATNWLSWLRFPYLSANRFTTTLLSRK